MEPKEVIENPSMGDCIGCGYDLRGLPAHGKCPECGVDVWRSRDGGRLNNVDPNWLRRVGVGTSIVVWTWFCLSGLALTAIAGALVMLAFFSNAPPPVWIDFGFFFWIVSLHAILALVAFGAVLAAWPEPREQSSPSPNVKRLFTRWGFVVCVAMLILIESRQINVMLGGWIELVVTLSLLPAWLTVTSLLFEHLGGFARRLAREHVGAQLGNLLAGHAAFFIRIAIGVLVLEIVLSLAFAFGRGASIRWVLGLVFVIAVPFVITAFTLAWGAGAALRDLKSELKRSLAQARQRQ